MKGGRNNQVVGRLFLKLLSNEKPRHAAPCLEATFGVVTLHEGSNVFHCPMYYPDPSGVKPALPPTYCPTQNRSPFFHMEDGNNRWRYRVDKELRLLKLYRDAPPPFSTSLSRTCLKAEAYQVLFGRNPTIPLHEWRGKTHGKRDVLVDTIFALGHDGFISTGDNLYDGWIQ